MTRAQVKKHLHDGFKEAGFSQADADYYSLMIGNSFTPESIVSPRLYENELVGLIKGLKTTLMFCPADYALENI